jgi:hypothetical protein
MAAKSSGLYPTRFPNPERKDVNERRRSHLVQAEYKYYFVKPQTADSL